MREQALLFGKSNSLVGVLTEPAESQRGRNFPAVILLNCGVMHRVGPHRLHVKISRRLASLGFSCLRFDLSGIGDSQARVGDLPRESSSIGDAQEAMASLSAERGFGRFILLGICAGGFKSFNIASHDPRVVGAALINVPFGATDERVELSVTARYYWRKALLSRDHWAKVIRGEANYSGVRKVLTAQLRGLFTLRRPPPEESEFVAGVRSLLGRGCRLLLVYSEDDYSLSYFRGAFPRGPGRLEPRGSLTVELIPHADHTFTPLRGQELLLKTLCEWAGATAWV